MVLQENIAAISTPSGVGGVAIIRISGENPLAILSQMFPRVRHCGRAFSALSHVYGHDFGRRV